MNSLLSAVIFSTMFVLVALGFDMGITYRVQLMYSATHPLNKRRPHYRIRLASRHIVLFGGVIFGVCLNLHRPFTEPTPSLIGWAILTAIYVAMIIRDALNEIRTTRS